MSIQRGANSIRVLAPENRPERLFSSCLTQALLPVKFYSWKQDAYFYETSINYIIKKLTLIMGKFLGDEQYRLWKEEPRNWEEKKPRASVPRERHRQQF